MLYNVDGEAAVLCKPVSVMTYFSQARLFARPIERTIKNSSVSWHVKFGGQSFFATSLIPNFSKPFDCSFSIKSLEYFLRSNL